MEVNRGENGDEGKGNEERSEDLSVWSKLSGQEPMPLLPESLPPLHFYSSTNSPLVRPTLLRKLQTLLGKHPIK